MTANASIRSAFHELTMTLLGLFEVYDAKPELVEHAAEEIESILRRHIGAPPGPPGGVVLATLATTVAGHILKREINAGDQEKLVQESLAELSKLNRN